MTEPRRILVAAFGDPGHAFPAIALGRELAQRGHDVCLETWAKWQEHVEREGMQFAAAPEYQVFPTEGKSLKPYAAAVWASGPTRELIRSFDPDAVVADIITVAASLAAQAEKRPWATLVPHLLPTPEPGFPPYSIGARLPRTRLGSKMWQTFDPLLRKAEAQGRDELNETRRRVGLEPLPYLHGGISRELAIVASFPQLEYPRASWEPWARVTGPLMWEQPYDEVELPPGDDPLVLLAPSTSQDPDQRMLAAALEGLAGEHVRVIASTNRRPPPGRLEVPSNAMLVDWLSYSRTMPHCHAVVCHAGHGTVARALASGVPLVACPAAGDMAENGSRLAWSGLGVSVPRRLITPRGLRLAVRKVLSEPSYKERAGELAAWAERHDGAATAADAVEELIERRVRVGG